MGSDISRETLDCVLCHKAPRFGSGKPGRHWTMCKTCLNKIWRAASRKGARSRKKFIEHGRAKRTIAAAG